MLTATPRRILKKGFLPDQRMGICYQELLDFPLMFLIPYLSHELALMMTSQPSPVFQKIVP